MSVQNIGIKPKFTVTNQNPNSKAGFGKSNYDQNIEDSYVSSYSDGVNEQKNADKKGFIKRNLGKILIGTAAIGAATVGIIAAVKHHNFKKELTGIYDKVWDDIFKNSDLVKKMNLKKPEFHLYKEKGTLAGYVFETHKCILNPSYYKKYKFVVLKSNGELLIREDNKLLYTAAEIKKLKEKNIEGIKILELTKDEKKLYFASCMAHELSHAVATNTLLHTKSVGKTEILKHLKEKGFSEEFCSRVANYNPGNFMEDSIKFKIPIINLDGSQKTLIYSSDNEILKGYKAVSEKGYKGDRSKYYNNPLEIHANAESLDFMYKNKEFSNNCRDEIIKAIKANRIVSLDKGLS